MHQIVSSRPEFVEFEKRKAKARADRDDYVAEAKRRQQAYELAAMEALDKGTRIPEAPQDAKAGDRALALQLERIAADEKAWIAENADEFTAEVFAREDAMVAEAGGLLASLEALVDEASALRATLAGVRSHAGEVDSWRGAGTNLALLVECTRKDVRMLREPYATARQVI